MENPFPPQPTPTDFSDHDVWRVLLIASPISFRSVFFNVATHVFAPFSHKTWSADDNCLRMIEDAVYENPLILDDYDTTLLVQPSFTSVFPKGLADSLEDDEIHDMLHAAYPVDNMELITDRAAEVVFAMLMPKGIRSFFDRTFATEAHHILHPMHDYNMHAAANEGGDRMWVDFPTSDTLHVTAWSSGELKLCTAWKFRTPQDAAYYILYAWQTLGLETSSGEIRISGNAETRNVVLPLLRKHIGYVSLTILPSYVRNAVDKGLPLTAILACTSRMK